MAGERRIGPYEVVRELGRGGMGVVYEVRHPDVPRPLALKLTLSRAASATALARFEREARLLARVQHPCVLRVHSLEAIPEGPYLITELVEGTPLDELTRAVGEGRPLGARRVAALVRDLADGLAALHAQGILHRDLKPSNVIVRPDGSPVLLDFGLARELAAERLTETGALLGTPAFMAPEQTDDAGPASLDERADVYGLGAVLFACLAGRAPFVADSPVAVLYRVLKEEAVWPPQPEPEGEWLVAVGRKAMAKDRDARYMSALELRDDLDRVARGEEPLASLESVRRARALAARALRRRRRIARVVVGLAAVALLAAAVALGRSAGLRARGREALASARRFDADVLRPWGLGLGAGAPPAELARVERHAATLRATRLALAAPEAAEAAALIERLEAARHAVAGTAPEAPSDAHAWVAAGVEALRRGDLGAAAAAASAAEELEGRSDPVAWLRCELVARHEPLALLQTVSGSGPGDPRRQARPALSRALEGAYLAALAEALRGEAGRLAQVVEAADRLGLDLDRVRGAKTAFLADAARLAQWTKELQGQGREAEPALEALERLSLAHATRPRVTPTPALVGVLHGCLTELARRARRALVPSADLPEERARTISRLLRFEAACAWPLGVDTRLDAVEDFFAEHGATPSLATTTPETFTRLTVGGLRVGRRARSFVFGFRVDAFDPATLDALARSGDPLIPIYRRFDQRPLDDAGLEDALRALPERALREHHRGELLVLAAWFVVDDAGPGAAPARLARVRQLVTAAREHLRARPVALARSYEVEAHALADLGGDQPGALALIQQVEPRFRPGRDATPEALDAHDRLCMWLAWTEHMADPRAPGPVERARAVAERAQARGAAVRRDARIVLSKLLARQGKGADALLALEPITPDDREDPNLWVAEASALHVKGDRARAAEVLEALLRRFGHIPAVRRLVDETRQALR